jgi:hypothetical protein
MYTTTKKDLTQIGGTSLVDSMDTTYETLIRVFGEPTGMLDNYKSDAAWDIQTPYGVACIYNYKTGKNYLGDEGKETKDITDWHIGAHNSDTAEFIVRAINISTDITVIDNEWMSLSLEDLYEKQNDLENEFNDILRRIDLEEQEDMLNDKLEEIGEVQVAIAKAE